MSYVKGCQWTQTVSCANRENFGRHRFMKLDTSGLANSLKEYRWASLGQKPPGLSL